MKLDIIAWAVWTLVFTAMKLAGATWSWWWVFLLPAGIVVAVNLIAFGLMLAFVAAVTRTTD